MSTETWGQMNKSQTDATLIEERITQMISEHNDDPTAHMADAQSIGQHRINSVIDHPLGSVLADKKTQTELFLQTQFENSAVFGKTGTPTFLFPGFSLQPTATGSTHYQNVYIDGNSSALGLYFNRDITFQFSLNADTYNGGRFKASCGYNYGSMSESGMGFEIINSVAKFYVSKEDFSSKTYLSWPTYEDVTDYIIRLQYVASTGLVSVYINGELLGTLTFPDTSAGDALVIEFFFYAQTELGHVCSVHDMTFAQTIV